MRKLGFFTPLREMNAQCHLLPKADSYRLDLNSGLYCGNDVFVDTALWIFYVPCIQGNAG